MSRFSLTVTSINDLPRLGAILAILIWCLNYSAEQCAAQQGNWHGSMRGAGGDFEVLINIAKADTNSWDVAWQKLAYPHSKDIGKSALVIDKRRVLSNQSLDGRLSMVVPNLCTLIFAKNVPTHISLTTVDSNSKMCYLSLIQRDGTSLIPPLHPQLDLPDNWCRKVEVHIESADHVKLNGTLFLPPGDGPFSAGIWIYGGPSAGDRNGYADSNNVIASRLAKRRFATLFYDDRGAGTSGGNKAQQTLSESAADIAAWGTLLGKMQDINSKDIFVIGESEGSSIAALAIQRNLFSSAVLLSPMTVDYADYLCEYDAMLATSQLRTHGGLIGVTERAAICRAMKRSIQAAIEGHEEPRNASENAIRQDAELSTDDWNQNMLIRFIQEPTDRAMRFDKRRKSWITEAIGGIFRKAGAQGCPLLVVMGTRDTNPYSRNQEGLAKMLSPLANVTICKLAITHDLIDDGPAGSDSEYDVGQLISDKLLDQITSWLERRGNRVP